VLAALLFAGYLRVSWTVAATSDGAAQALQARDMLAGNWLLHGWTLSDVSFYTTELPEYVLVELARPFGVGVIHVAAAVTYTLLVLAVVALARSRGGAGRAGLFSGGAAGLIMLAPQLGYGAFVLLLSPDHVGTQVPLLVCWLLIDRAPGRRWLPVAVCLLLAWVQFADRVALLTAVLPLVVVCVARGARRLPREPRGDARTDRELGAGARGRFEGGLAVGAVASVGVAWAGARVLAAAGGFAAHPLPFTLAPARLLWTHAWLTGWGVLEVYGGNLLGVTSWDGRVLAAVHLAGLALAVVGTGVAFARFVRSARADLVESVLAVAIVANLVSYVVSIEPGTVLGTGYDAREIAAVLPLGAVLAGRVCGPWLAGVLSGAHFPSAGTRGARLVGGVVVAGYLVAFGCSVGQDGVAGRYSVLAGWLVAHGMRDGLGGESANVVTVDSGGRVVVEPAVVRGGRVVPLFYQSTVAGYRAGRGDARFLVVGGPADGAGYAPEDIPAAVVRATFGMPTVMYRFDGFTVDTWNVNLLTKLRK
jgi:hypothetical protein